MVQRICEQCSGEFNKSPAAIARGEGRFCSNACRDAYKRLHVEERSGEKAPVWKGGVRKRYPRTDYAWVYDRVKYALKKRVLQKGPCMHCGTTEDIHAHHEDYSKPLEVTWLCRPCHSRYHALKQMWPPIQPRNRERQKRERDAAKSR